MSKKVESNQTIKYFFVCAIKSPLLCIFLKRHIHFVLKTLNKHTHTNEKWQKFKNVSRFSIFRIINCLFQVKTWNWIFCKMAKAIKYFKNNVFCFLFIFKREINCNTHFSSHYCKYYSFSIQHHESIFLWKQNE